tara:strand:+ start:45 stop:1790 length:1746 start_codon:yes stop_codon:yes gene_type:complete
MSFFVADNKIPIEQTSIGVPSTNGLSYNPNQIIEFHIDPQQVKFFNPKESYLSWDVLLQMPNDTNGQLTRLMLDSEIGAQSLIREIRIHDGNNNALLEEIVGYNIATMVKYNYDENVSLRNKRALTEGAGDRKTPHGQTGTTWSYQNSAQNPYTIANSGTQTASLTNASYTNVRCCLPLNTGIFSNDKVFPCMLTNGLRISILLEDAVRCIRQMEGNMVNRKTPLNPHFHSVNGCSTNAGAGSGSLVAGATTTSFFLTADNGYLDSEDLPFCVGESINFYQTAPTPGYFTRGGGDPAPIITQIEYDTGKKLLKLTTTSFSLTTTLTTIKSGSNVMYSKSSEVGSPYNATYKISNAEMYLQVVDMGSQYENDMVRRMKEGGTINYDFLSMTNYRYSQLAGDIVANIQMPIENRRMKSIICIPTDASLYTGTQTLTASGTYEVEITGDNNLILNQDRCGLAGISDFISSYQFLYDGKLQPSRLVNCSNTSGKKGVSQQHLVELEKSLSSAGITGQSLLQFNRNFVIGRSLTAGGNGVYDGRGRQFALQVNYQGSSPTKNKLWNNFCYHIRRMVISGDNISIEM